MMKPDESSCWPKGGFEFSCFIDGTFAFLFPVRCCNSDCMREKLDSIDSFLLGRLLDLNISQPTFLMKHECNVIRNTVFCAQLDP